MPEDFSTLTARIDQIESRLELAERALTVEMLALIRELPPKEVEEVE